MFQAGSVAAVADHGPPGPLAANGLLAEPLPSIYDYVRRGVSAQTAPADRVIAALYLTAISPQFQVIE